MEPVGLPLEGGPSAASDCIENGTAYAIDSNKWGSAAARIPPSLPDVSRPRHYSDAAAELRSVGSGDHENDGMGRGDQAGGPRRNPSLSEGQLQAVTQ